MSHLISLEENGVDTAFLGKGGRSGQLRVDPGEVAVRRAPWVRVAHAGGTGVKYVCFGPNKVEDRSDDGVSVSGVGQLAL